ncbi:hypothetical protein Q7P37_002682 [Cladosporium fusiforme]
MAKRKRTQASAPVADQSAGQVDHKKPKVDSDITENAQIPHSQSNHKSETTEAALTSNPQTTDAGSPPAVTHDDPSLTKSQRKRHRKMQKLRQEKKAARSGEKPVPKEPRNDTDHDLPEKKRDIPTETPGLEQKRKASSQEISIEKYQKPVTSKISKAPRNDSKSEASTKKQHEPASNSLKSLPKDATKQTAKHEEPKASASEKLTDSRSAAGGKTKRRQKRRKQLSARRRSSVSAPDENLLASPSSGNSKKQDSSPKRSALQDITKTTLLSRPQKQWIEQDDASSPDADTTLHEDVTQTTLLRRPMKQWIQQDESEVEDAATEPNPSDQIQHQDNAKRQTKRAKTPTTGPVERTSASNESSPSQRSDDEKLSREERSFAKVGVPTTTATPATRPGIHTIASFSLSSRRHPAGVLSHGTKSSGLSSLRTDAGSFGGHAKPISSLKANSVPSYSSRGDVKAAFQRFNNFAHNRDELDSDEDSDDSDSESESEMEVEKTKVSIQGKSVPDIVTSGQASQSKLDDPKALPAVEENTSDGGANSSEEISHQPKDIVDATKASTQSSSESSVGDDEEEREHDTSTSAQETRPQDDGLAQNPAVNDGQTSASGEALPEESPGATVPMDGGAEITLFSDFNARYSDQPTNTGLTRSGSFLGQDLGGNPGGAGATDDPSSANFLEDRDDLFRSIDEISRDVFGATRALPDCKPLSNTSDPISDPPVTETLSNNRLKRKLARNATPEKAAALNSMVRASSPVVWIVNADEISDNLVVDNGKPRAESSSSATSLSSLSRSPTPPDDSSRAAKPLTSFSDIEANEQPSTQEDEEDERDVYTATPVPMKRKMTGTTSTHFSPQKSQAKTKQAFPISTEEDRADLHPIEPVHPTKAKRTSKKQTGTTSTFFTPTSSPVKPTDPSNPTPSTSTKKPRAPKGTSTSLVPSTASAHFGLIQEKLWDQPFWLIIAVTFLNKTTGRAAVPIFWSLKTLYPTPEALSQAKEFDLVALITTLGLQNQRAKRLISIANAWLENPPIKSHRYRTLHYPAKNDGKSIKKDDTVESDADDCAGALEIGHIPGCGPYAWDSWRIFCRDVTRGIAQDYNGKGAVASDGFVPEWQRVLPLDKELRACLRWMWLREGWVWDPETGERRVATEGEREAGQKGQMVLEDEAERRFAREAAVAGSEAEDDDEVVKQEGDVVLPLLEKRRKRSRRESIAHRGLDFENGSAEVVAPASASASASSPPAKRARRAGRAQRAKRS